MDKKKSFVIIFVVWILLIAVFVGVKEYTLQSGEKVLLKTELVDPRDLFRGDYIILNYEISRIDPSLYDNDVKIEKGDKIYVLLEEVDGYYSVKDYSAEKPVEGLFIKGKVTSSYTIMSVDYGIEDYFVPEGEGRELEKFRNMGELDVEVAIDSFGNSAIVRLLVDGEEVKV